MVAPVQVWVALEQEIFLGLSGLRLKRLLAPSLIDFQGNPGIRALYQAIGIRTTDDAMEWWKKEGRTGGKDPHPQDFSLTKKTARFTKGQFRPYSSLTTDFVCGKMHREGSCSKAAGGP